MKKQFSDAVCFGNSVYELKFVLRAAQRQAPAALPWEGEPVPNVQQSRLALGPIRIVYGLPSTHRGLNPEIFIPRRGAVPNTLYRPPPKIGYLI